MEHQDSFNTSLNQYAWIEDVLPQIIVVFLGLYTKTAYSLTSWFTPVHIAQVGVHRFIIGIYVE